MCKIIVADIISNVEESNDDWKALAADELGDRFQDYLNHGEDSVQLANLIYITWEIVSLSSGDDLSRQMAYRSLRSLSNFDIRKTLPELKHEFHALWSEIVKNIRDAGNRAIWEIHESLLDLYNALPQETNNTSTDQIDKVIDENPHNTGHTTTDVVNETPPSDPPCAVHPTSLVAASLYHTPPPKPLKSNVASGDSTDVASTATATPGHIADTLSGGQSTLPPIHGGVPLPHAHSPTRSAMAPSAHISRNNTPESSSPASQSVTSPVAPQLVDPSDSSTGPTNVHDDTQDTSDPPQLELSHSTHHLDPSDSPA